MNTVCLQGTCSLLPFHIPSESICDRAYIEETPRTAASWEDTDSGDDSNNEQIEETSGHVIVRSYRQPINPEKAQHQPSSGETSNLFVSQRCLHSPYRSQSPVGTPAHDANKQHKHVPLIQKEKKSTHTVYVTLDIFKQGQDGSKQNKSWVQVIQSRSTFKLCNLFLLLKWKAKFPGAKTLFW